MFASMIPALHSIPFAPPAAADAERAQRSNAIAERGSTREAAQQAIHRDDGHSASPDVKPDVATVVTTAEGTTATVKVWDVNGDGAKDAVVTDTASGATSALLNRGGDLLPQLDTKAVSLTAPTAIDVDRLAVEGDKTGRDFLAIDLDGDGVRQTAVERAPGEWISLGPSQDVAAGSGQTPIQQTERHFEALVAELNAVLPVFAQYRAMNRLQERRAGGFGEMINAALGQHALNGYNVDERSFGQMLLSDAARSLIAAFGLAADRAGLLSINAPASATGSRP